jgi:hypothetical protein
MADYDVRKIGIDLEVDRPAVTRTACHLVSLFQGFATVRCGSVAVVQPDSSAVAALGRIADVRPGSMAAFTQTGRSDGWKSAQSNVRYRPEADFLNKVSMRQFVITDRVCLIDVVRP